MAGHRSHSVAFEGQVVQEYLSGETLHGLAIFAERYRNRRRHFGLRLNLIAAIANLELTA